MLGRQLSICTLQIICWMNSGPFRCPTHLVELNWVLLSLYSTTPHCLPSTPPTTYNTPSTYCIHFFLSKVRQDEPTTPHGSQTPSSRQATPTATPSRRVKAIQEMVTPNHKAKLQPKKVTPSARVSHYSSLVLSVLSAYPVSVLTGQKTYWIFLTRLFYRSVLGKLCVCVRMCNGGNNSMSGPL